MSKPPPSPTDYLRQIAENTHQIAENTKAIRSIIDTFLTLIIISSVLGIIVFVLSSLAGY